MITRPHARDSASPHQHHHHCLHRNTAHCPDHVAFIWQTRHGLTAAMVFRPGEQSNALVRADGGIRPPAG